MKTGFTTGSLVQQISDPVFFGRIIYNMDGANLPFQYAVRQIPFQYAAKKVTSSDVVRYILSDDLRLITSTSDGPLGVAMFEVMEKMAKMSPEEKEAMFTSQRESFVRGMSTPCEHGVLDFEQCHECRMKGVAK